MIHRLGIESVPVDESSDSRMELWNSPAIEPAPSLALLLHGLFSTRLFV
jgi:hypothetical protein